MKEEDLLLWEDNCRIKTCECTSGCVRCPRQMFSTDIVDQDWFDWKQRKKGDSDSFQEAVKKTEVEKTAFDKKVNVDKMTDAEKQDIDPKVLAAMKLGETISPPDDENMDVNYNNSICYDPIVSNKTLRSNKAEPEEQSTSPFPKVPLRLGRNTLNPKVMRGIIHCQATYKVSDRDIRGICTDFANLVFDQQWQLDSDLISNIDENSDDEQEGAGSKRVHEDDENLEGETMAKKKRKVQHDLSNRFPARPTIKRWMEAGAIFNLKYVADKLIVKTG